VKPKGRDYAWGAFAILFGLLSAAGWVIRFVRTITGDVSLGAGLLSLVAGGLIAFWITVGAWRRTAWAQTPN
jgi:hypothetical protein